MFSNVESSSPAAGMWYAEWKAMNAKEEDDAFCLRNAIENWSEQKLTGGRALTDEEKEKIRELIANWLEENSLETEEDKRAFSAFVKKVYLKFGAKHDLMDFIEETMIAKWLEANQFEVPLETRSQRDAFAAFTRILSIAMEMAKTSIRDLAVGNGTLINFDGQEMDPVPSRLYPLQMRLQVEETEAS